MVAVPLHVYHISVAVTSRNGPRVGTAHHFTAGFALNNQRPEGDLAIVLIDELADKLKEHQVRYNTRF
jgi:hypothetical protein